MNEEEVSFESGWESEEFDSAAEAVEETEEAVETPAEAAKEPAAESFAAEEKSPADTLAQFAAKHPQLKAESIPDEVWAQVASGETLENAWLRYEAKWTGLVMDSMARESENRRRSTGSRRSEGGNGRADPFDEGWCEI